MRRLMNLLARNAKRGEFRAEGNTIFVYDSIVSSDADAEWWGGVSAEAFAKALAGMEGDVSIRINSPGGDVFAARAMAQAMREHNGEITCFVDGYAASAASLIAISGAKCAMAPGSMMMIHKAWTIEMGNADDMKATAALLDKIDGTLAQSYAAKSGGNAADFAEMMAKETWMTAEEAVAAKLCDEALEDKPATASNSIRWDLSAYATPPKADTTTVTVTVVIEDDDDDAAEEAAEAEAAAKNNSDQRIRAHAARMLLESA